MRKRKNIAHACLYFSSAERIPFTEHLFSGKNMHFHLSSLLLPFSEFYFLSRTRNGIKKYCSQTQEVKKKKYCSP